MTIRALARYIAARKFGHLEAMEAAQVIDRQGDLPAPIDPVPRR